MITIDGSQGEGGGQVLRSALTLSLITNQPFRIKNIRANRPKPGLKPQHLMSVFAAKTISNANVSGDDLHSKELIFKPGKIKSGEYKFDIRTAGSVSLVLQTIYLPLVLDASPSSVTLTGGTHVPFSPSFHFLDKHWRYFLSEIGINLNLTLKRAGFYPKGGGEIYAQFEPVKKLNPLNIIERGKLHQIKGTSIISNLKSSVDSRQKEKLDQLFKKKGLPFLLKSENMPAVGSNAISFLAAHFENSQIVSVGLGAKGKPVEKVADEAVSTLLKDLTTNSTVDVCLADQLMLPLSLVPQKSEIIVSYVTGHIATLKDIIQIFIPAKINFIPQENSTKIRIHGISM